MNRQPQLEQVQRWLQAVITCPDGVRAGIDSDDAKAQIPITQEQVEKVINRSNAQSSLERLNVYANAYYARLIECLAQEYQAVSYAVGEETFRAFAFGYLQMYPSKSYTLNQLGSRFSEYLEKTQPSDSDLQEWGEFLVDTAKVERAYSEVFDGPGVENEPLLDPEALQRIPRADLPSLRLKTVPCLRLLAIRYPVHEYISTVRNGKAARVPDPESTCLILTRKDFIVRRFSVTRCEYEILNQIHQGESLSDAIMAGLQFFDGQTDVLQDQLQRWFHVWAKWGFFQQVSTASEANS